MSRSISLALSGAGFVLLVTAWVFSSTPFHAPDEPSHELRAVSIADGTMLGPRVNVAASTPAQTAYIRQNARGETVDPRLIPPGWSCVTTATLRQRGRCLAPNYNGNYLPLPYLLPSLAVQFANHTGRALWLGRLASALQSLAFVILALALLWQESSWSMLGLLAALTPTTLFMTSVINPDGLELTANLALAAGLLRVSRAPSKSPAWVWTASAVSGAVVVLAWQLGWLFVAADVAVVAALLGWATLHELIREQRRRLVLAGLLLGGALALYLAWGLSTGLLHGSFGVSPWWASLRAGLRQLKTALYGAVGLFGTLDISLPSNGYYWVWWALILTLVAGAILLAPRRERALSLVVAILVLVFPVLFYAWVQRHSGFGLEPRYVLPLLALIPLLSGELVFRHGQRLPAAVKRLAPGALIALIACFQLFAWWVNARASAGEPHAVWFLTSPHWSPPGGWAPWTILAALGSLALLALAATQTLGARAEAVSPADRREPQRAGPPLP